MISETAATPGVAGTGRDYAAEQRRWEERALQRALARGERKEPFATGSGIEVEPAVRAGAARRTTTRSRRRGSPASRRSRAASRPPCTAAGSGASASTPATAPPRDANERFRFLLANGQKGLSVAFDLPTQMGLDSDDPRAAGEVGQVGVAIDSVADMEDLFAEIPLDAVSTSMTINAPAPVLVAMYIVAAERQGVPAEAVMGTAQNDVLKEYVARGTYIYPPRPSLRLAADLIAHCARHAPKFNAISLSGYHIREAGSTAPQEMAFAVANACEYVAAAVERGVAVDDFAPKLSWIFNTHTDFFEEIAKYRALRRLWARVMSERFGATDPRSLMLRTHTQTGGSTLTAQQPENNIVRAAIQALAASARRGAVDGAVVLRRGAVHPHREGAAHRGAHPADHRRGDRRHQHRRPARRLVLRRVAHRRARAPRHRTARRRSTSAAAPWRASSSGWMQEQIQEEAYRAELAVVSGEKVVVGVNRYTETEEAQPPVIFRTDERAANEQLERLRSAPAAPRRRRGRPARSLRLRTAAAGDGELMPRDPRRRARRRHARGDLRHPARRLR